MRKVVPIPLSSTTFPLPSDYDSLTGAGRRLARVNACRQWILQGTPEERARRLIASTWFFDRYYLHADPDDDFDPSFYDMPPLPTPQMHWDLSRSWATSRNNVAIAPRGSAKSTHIRKDTILRMVSCPNYSLVYATSNVDNAKHTGQSVKEQCHNNRRISDDFSPEPEFDNNGLRPARGMKPSGIEYFYVNNGSWLRCLSAESRIRGLRPRRFRLDDPEYDEKASTSMSTIRTYMETLLFKVAIPTTMRVECGIDWVGTFVSKRHFLWHAMNVVETETGLRAQDPRFDHWSRLFIPACYECPTTGELVSAWPEMWPVSDSKKVPGYEQAISLEHWRQVMGAGAFNNEMLGRPGESDDQFFKFDSAVTGRHGWWLEGVDEFVKDEPRRSSALLCYVRPDGTTERQPLGQFLAQCSLFCCVDTAFSETATSDRRVSHVMGLSRDGILFSLDMWSDRKTDAVLVTETFRLCHRWKCPVVFVEVVRNSLALYQRFKAAVIGGLHTDLGFSFTPRIRDFRPGTAEKTAKISTLDVRFEHGAVKLPLFKRADNPGYVRLCDQIEGFNPDVRDGGLEKDDELDTLSMSRIVLKAKARPFQEEEKEPLDPVSEIREGRLCVPGTNISYASGLPLSMIDGETWGQLLATENARKGTKNGLTKV